MPQIPEMQKKRSRGTFPVQSTASENSKHFIAIENTSGPDLRYLAGQQNRSAPHQKTGQSTPCDLTSSSLSI